MVMDRLIRYNGGTNILVGIKSINITVKGSRVEFAANRKAGENCFVFAAI